MEPFKAAEAEKVMQLKGNVCLGVWNISEGDGGARHAVGFEIGSIDRVTSSSSSKLASLTSPMESLSSSFRLGEMFSKCML